MIKKGNKRVQITIPKTKYKAFKKMAVDKECNLSDILVDAGTASYDEWLKSKENKSESGTITQKQNE